MRKPGYIIVTLKFRKEGRRWTALCDELGTATFGRSIQEAKARLEEAVQLHLNTLEEVGECERFLRENGIAFYKEKPRGDREVSVPLSLGLDAFLLPHVFPVRREICV
jgi:predicted RNase H-like HicB family nuclease